MSNRKLIFWLLVGTIVAVSANIFLTFYAGVSPAKTKFSLFGADFEPHAIALAYDDGFEAKMTDEAGWKLVEPYSAELDGQSVMRLIDAFVISPVIDSASEREMLQKGHTRKDYGLMTPRVQVTFSDGDESIGIAIGEMSASSNGVYATVEGSGYICVLSTNCWTLLARRLEPFRKREVLDVAVEAIGGFEFKRPDSVEITSFVRTQEGWKTGSENASVSKVEQFLGMVAEARVRSFVWPTGKTDEGDVASGSLLAGYGLNPENASAVTFKCADGVDRRLLFGNIAGEGLVYALVHDGRTVITVDSALKEMLMQKSSTFTDLRIFPLEVSAVSSFSIIDGAESYRLARDANDGWRLDAPISAAADKGAVEAVLAKLLALTTIDLAEDGVKVTVNTNGAERCIQSGKLNGFAYASLRSLTMTRVEPSAVRRVVVTADDNRQTAVVFSRDLNVWNVEKSVEGKSADVKSIAQLLAALNPLQAERVVALKVQPSEVGKFGLEKPYRIISIDHEKADTIRRNIILGAMTEGGRYATVGSSDAVFVISNETVEKLCRPLIAK